MNDILSNPIIMPQWKSENTALAAFAGMRPPETGEDVAAPRQSHQIAETHVQILNLGPGGGILPPADPSFGPVIRTIPIQILIDAPPGIRAPIPTRLAFTAMHPLPAHIIPPPARLRIRLTASTHRKLQRSTLGRTIIGNHIEIPELLGSIGGILLEPGETLPILLEYETDYLDEGSVLRVLQYAGEADAERLAFVQIFVFTGVSR